VDQHRIQTTDNSIQPAVKTELSRFDLRNAEPQRLSEVIITWVGPVAAAPQQFQDCGPDPFLKIRASYCYRYFFGQNDQLSTRELAELGRGKDCRVIVVRLSEKAVSRAWKCRRMIKEGQAEGATGADPEVP